MNCGKKIFGLLMLCSAASIAADCTVTSYYSARSQGVNAVRQMVGWENLINLCNKDCWYSAGAVALEYTQSFKSNRICQCLFGTTAETAGCNSFCPTSCSTDCDGCSIFVAGSCVDNRNSQAWVADYFGLPSDYQSIISFRPRVRNFVADLQFYVGFDTWVEGLWFRINLPITNTRWALRPNEVVSTNGNIAPYPAGYFSAQAVPRSQLVNTALDFFSGCTAPDLSTGQTPSVTFQPLRYGKWATCESLHLTRLADVTMALGYNFICNACGYFGLSLRFSAPAGNRPEGEFLFEPIVGNGHHWTLGAGMNAHYELWSSEENESTFGFYLDAAITHLFTTSQTRTFDLCAQGSNSRYMLAQRLTNATALFGAATAGVVNPADAIQSDLQFANEFAPVANLTATKVRVKASVEGEIALKFAYETDCGFSWDIGYNFWGRSCERVTPNNECNTVDLSQWALKGDAYVYGFAISGVTDGTPIPLGATENDATINSSTGIPSICSNSINGGIDKENLAYFNNGGALTPIHTFGTATQTHTSIQPITLDTDVINYSSNRGISNKLFTHISYTWKDCETWKPFLGIGASAEFGQSCNNRCNETPGCGTSCKTNCCDGDSSGTCVSCALNQWAVWIKGGVLYN
jgi:hypothetical protein